MATKRCQVTEGRGGGLSILRVSKDVTSLRVRGDTSIMWVSKDVTLFRERGNMSLVWVRKKDVKLLREGGDIYKL